MNVGLVENYEESPRIDITGLSNDSFNEYKDNLNNIIPINQKEIYTLKDKINSGDIEKQDSGRFISLIDNSNNNLNILSDPEIKTAYISSILYQINYLIHIGESLSLQKMGYDKVRSEGQILVEKLKEVINGDESLLPEDITINLIKKSLNRSQKDYLKQKAE